MRASLVMASVAIISACGGPNGTGNAPAPEDIAALSACDAVAALAAGMDQSPPFANLVRAPREDEMTTRDKVTDARPWGQQCTYGVVNGWNDGDPDTHVFRCTIFDAGPSMFDEDKPKAEAAFAKARETLNTCLGESWTERENEMQQSGEETASFIYERASDIERRETSEMYMYPLVLRKAYFRSPESRGGPWGWIVDVAFQQQTAAASE